MTYGFMDRRGAWLIEPAFTDADPFEHGLARVTVDERIGYVDRRGRAIWTPR